MAKKGKVRRIYVTRTRRHSGGRKRGFLSGTIGRLIAGAIGFLGSAYILSRFVPAQYALAGTLAGAGGALYLLDGKSAGEALVGAGIGALALPYVMGSVAKSGGVTFD